jgi:HEAT repeats
MPLIFTIISMMLIISCSASDWAGRATLPVPVGAKVTLKLDRTEYLLGENVLVHFVLQNTGDTPFKSSWGSDYRGATRHLRFKVIATDAAGQIVEDPNPSTMCMGGRGGFKMLKPGEEFTTSLPLMRYCNIVKPGVYKIRITHDFGWKEGKRKRPIGELEITFRMPNLQQAKQVVNKMSKLPRWGNNLWGERSNQYADFRCLRYPIYMDLLVERAKKGDKRAFKGLGLIPTTKASEALIGLAGTLGNKELALIAAKTLNLRLPFAKINNIRTFPVASTKSKLNIRARLVQQTWNKELVPNIRKLAAKLLASGDIPIMVAGAFMIYSVGIKEDAPIVLTAINKSKSLTFKTRTDPNGYITGTPHPVRQLLWAMDILRSRGYVLGEHLSGSAEILLYFHILRNDPSPRSKRYRRLLEAFGTSGWLPTRVAAIRSIPKTIPPEYRNFILKQLEDKNLSVCRAACTAAGMSKDKRFLQPLLDIIATEQNKWLILEASNAFQKIAHGTKLPLLELWAERLADAKLYHHALDVLQKVLTVPSGGAGGRTDLSRAERLELLKAWKKFLTLHVDKIRTGKRFKLNDPAVTYALFGRARSWQLPDGTRWPVLLNNNTK